MKVNLRIMHLDDLTPGVRVEYEERDGSTYRATIVRKERGLWARTEQADGSLSAEHLIFAPAIKRIIKS